jgi:DNA-binding GntR family transcriptional regulator
MPVPEQRDAVSRHLLRDTAYTAVRDAIVDGTLGPGELLHDGELCGWLGLSRTPVRNALERLCDEGLVEMAPQRYTRVACLGARDARDAFPLLGAVHALATELAVPRLTADDVAALRAANEAFVRALRTRDATAAFAADDRFHGVFVAASGNRDVARVVDRLAARLHRLERLPTGALPGRRSVAQHEAIVARAANRDAGGAASATRENWMTLGALIERALAAPA